MRWVVLDERQDKLLRDVADIIGRAHASYQLKRLRRCAVFWLTAWRVLAPANYERWNDARLGRKRA